MKKSALIILEQPWGLDKKDQNVVSVLPYFQGLERLAGNFDLYHSNFYEAKSFAMALDELTQLDYKQYYLYIACHGAGARLGRMNLSSMLDKINNKAQQRNIVGVILGACLVGNKTSHFEYFTQASSIVWKIGYKCAVNWLDGTLLDLQFFNQLMGVDKRVLANKDTLLERIKQVACIYSPTAVIGKDVNKQPMTIADSLTLVMQPKGQGNKAKDYSSQLFDGN